MTKHSIRQIGSLIIATVAIYAVTFLLFHQGDTVKDSEQAVKLAQEGTAQWTQPATYQTKLNGNLWIVEGKKIGSSFIYSHVEIDRRNGRILRAENWQ